ncbi:MAG: ABC transporter ATP-binding protein [Cyanobacteriota bacterium]|nr:ABC transporter ATP-binding protein [Cyanobacteriota bacterium]
MGEEIAISLQNISKCFKRYAHPVDRLKEILLPQKTYAQEFWALRDINLEIAKGSSLGIVGRNGSGKSTLLQIVVGTLTPTSGQTQVNGRISALLELGSGFNPEFTGRQNVFLNGRLLGLEQKQIEAKFDDIAAFADIGDFIEQPVKTYSSGMFVRLAFAVAINVEPDILVVDEALAVGDEAFQRKCFVRIQAIQESGGTILFVSHSVSSIIELCKSAILIDSGELLLSGKPKLVTSNYQKLIYAPRDKFHQLREDIRNYKDINTVVNNLESPIVQVKSSIANSPTLNLQEFYDKNLIPKSTISYEFRGAKIEEPHITKINSERVNVILRRKEYIYNYRVIFDQDAYKVKFGMLIKTTSGFELASASSHPYSQLIDYVQSGTIIKVQFKFRCCLQPGTYFFNAGVTGIIDGQEVFLHRVIDAVMFRIQVEENMLESSFVDLQVQPMIAVIENVIR